MYKKISNNASRSLIESELGVTFKFPNLYRPRMVVDGVKENILSIMTEESPQYVSYGIWGLLPQGYHGEWSDFQKASNTLAMPYDQFASNDHYKTLYPEKRCLIVITGFFIYYLSEGTLYPYYVHMPSEKPFCIAGIYTTLDDGFITCAMLTKPAQGIVAKIQNIDATMPFILSASLHQPWLDHEVPIAKLETEIKTVPELPLKAHTIAKEFFKHKIIYTSLLEPVYYANVPETY